jgi:hypothetical protein
MPEKERDPVDLVGMVTEVSIAVLIRSVEDHVPAEYRAAVLRHLAEKVTLALTVRAAIEEVRTR